ncbi:GD23156 [Drosophila simulans]|uniref:GD23156 n=1 Tax=Drosophila simulans TaxID=7240 RepID=B4Q846_DROSI|nr:GD23156 [Drosophila simulans]
MATISASIFILTITMIIIIITSISIGAADTAIAKMECKCRVDLLIKHWSAAAEQRVAADDDANEVLAGNFN